MYEVKQSNSPLINCTWHAIAESDDIYTDAANEYWSLGFARHRDGRFSVDLFGPSLQPRALGGHAGEEYWGVEFNAHIVLKGMHKKSILNASTPLPVTDNHMTIGDHSYEIPTFDALESFTKQLEEDGIIINNQHIFRAMEGDETGFSQRSRQRHFVNTTGLTRKQIEQLKRARQAFYLLQSGHSPTDAAHLAGYADQSHMTRSLKLLRGETPAQIIAAYFKQA